ncbi:hypothetical protein CAPTEDRAFT_192713 [Capitella teleta]|uniref:Uncharacterized protein n=1 Tax=Capitella teleta TaxID=283909 RepID=R7TF54_CAPTE|nr:hypothetical protein CAPTEDRAFT_192713 [Capitella teleta]|eukprot:ELT92383.1 hypothetical protein CAPTEDRAFT_192713 [Capitella teleta]
MPPTGNHGDHCRILKFITCATEVNVSEQWDMFDEDSIEDFSDECFNNEFSTKPEADSDWLPELNEPRDENPKKFSFRSANNTQNLTPLPNANANISYQTRIPNRSYDNRRALGHPEMKPNNRAGGIRGWSTPPPRKKQTTIEDWYPESKIVDRHNTEDLSDTELELAMVNEEQNISISSSPTAQENYIGSFSPISQCNMSPIIDIEPTELSEFGACTATQTIWDKQREVKTERRSVLSPLSSQCPSTNQKFNETEERKGLPERSSFGAVDIKWRSAEEKFPQTGSEYATPLINGT